MIDGGQVCAEGVVEKIIFFNDDTQFCIAQMRPSGRGMPSEYSSPITIAGILAGLQCGETISVKGKWTRHPSYGARISVESFSTKLPSSVYGIVKFLGSGLIAGIGKKYAQAIVDRFGEDTLKIIDENSGRLLEVEGIGKKRARLIKKSWDEQRALRDVVMFLRTYGVGVSMCAKIVKRYGDEAIKIVRMAPYTLCREISGIGFKTADAIAVNSGVPNESKQRIQAGVLHCIKEAEEKGDTCIPRAELEHVSAQLLDVDKEKCSQAVAELVEGGELVAFRDGRIQRFALNRAERDIAEDLHRIFESGSGLPPIKFESALCWAKDRAGFEFAPEQSEGVLFALKSKVCVITGGPGTGKTTILKSLCDILRAKKITPVLAAPTGRAAQRMTESSGVAAKTIHRLLGYDASSKDFLHGRENPLDAKFVVIDEASMLDTKLASAVFGAVPSEAHLLLVGDVNQLPSVGPGNVLKDIISSARFPVIRLNKIFRQGARSDIALCARDILEGRAKSENMRVSKISDVDFSRELNFIEAAEPSECLDVCVRLMRDEIPRRVRSIDPLMDVQLLAPMKKGTAGIAAFNSVLSQELNGGAKSVLGSSLREADKVMQTRNNYELDIFNGDIGRVGRPCADNSAVWVKFDSRMVEVPRADLSDLQPAYAISVHKSQGSEFEVVVIALLKQHFLMLQRNLLYTAITRGRKKVFVVGDMAAWEMAVKNSKSLRRRTALAERL